MIKSNEQAKRIQSKREGSGKSGIAMAVRRYLKRTNQSVFTIK